MRSDYVPLSQGWIEVVVGCMFSGKSEELIRRVRRSIIAGRKAVVFKPDIDARYDQEDVMSHDGRRTTAVAVKDSAGARKVLDSLEADVVAFDEIQFFDQGIVALCSELSQDGKRVICAGLDMDFRAEPFGVVPEMLARAEYVDKLHAVCVVCGSAATRTQRLVAGMPARRSDPVVMVGAQESYEARCRSCHVILEAEVGVLFDPE